MRNAAVHEELKVEELLRRVGLREHNVDDVVMLMKRNSLKAFPQAIVEGPQPRGREQRG